MQEGGDWEGVRQPLDGPLLPHSGEIGADLCPALELCVFPVWTQRVEGCRLPDSKTRSSDSWKVPRILSPEPGAWLHESKSAVAVKGVAYAGGGSKPQKADKTLTAAAGCGRMSCAVQVREAASHPVRGALGRQRSELAKPRPATSRLRAGILLRRGREHRSAVF